MIPLLTLEFFTNRFVETQLPTKGQIFDRTGKCAVSPAGSYTGDDPARIGASTTEQAETFARTAEAYVRPEPEKPKDNE